MNLKEALSIKSGEIISIVGGGGKTTLMYSLARELIENRATVITTTTTKILEPSAEQSPFLILETEEEKLIKLVLENLNKYRHLTIVSEKLSSGKLDGIRPELVIRLAELDEVSNIIIEADGAAGKSLKAPRPHEPVIPDNTTLLIPVVGIDAIGCRLTDEAVFKPEIIADLLGLKIGEIVTAELIARLVVHPQGLVKGCPPNARIIPFLNKADLDNGIVNGRKLAYKILAKNHPNIEQVVSGHIKLPEPVAEIIRK